MIIVITQRWQVATLTAIILIGGCLFAFNAGTDGSKKRTSKGVELADEAASGLPPGKELRSENTSVRHTPEVDYNESLATITEMPQFGEIEPDIHDISPVTMPSVSSTDLVAQGNNKLGSSESVETENHKSVAERTPNDGAHLNSRGTTEVPLASDLTERDVMQELEVLTKSAANKAVESDFVVPDAEVSNAVSEPLMLHTSPMVQTQKVAARIKVRPRQPVWQILLSVDDEFDLTSNEWQSVSDRQITTWFLSDSDSQSPKVRLAIQAQAAPGRQTALRWRIFAGAEDLPDLMLPLDKEILHPLQDRLRIYSQVSQREADRLKQLASSAERDVRATLSKQRSSLESQSKFASRLSTIVAEAELLDDLLRSQVTVYAKLRDGAASDAPTLLQFGDPSELKLDEESKPTTVAE